MRKFVSIYLGAFVVGLMVVACLPSESDDSEAGLSRSPSFPEWCDSKDTDTDTGDFLPDEYVRYEACWEELGYGGGETICIDGDADGDGSEPEPDDDPTGPGESDSEEDCEEGETVLYMSADDSNSMADPVLARALIAEGRFVFKRMRAYEFLNYYSFDYPAAPSGYLKLYAEMARGVDPNTYNLQIGVRSEDLSQSLRRPLNITLSIDTSGSMSGQPIELARESCRALAGSLKPGDVVSMVTWNSSQNILLDSLVIGETNDPSLVSACTSLEAGGSTDLHSGLVTAYELAEANFSSSRINRVVLISDGGANVGITDQELIGEKAADAEQEPIYLMGVGISNVVYYNHELMDVVTDLGKGSYIYIDSAEEADLMFGERFISNVEVAAKDVRLELTLPEGLYVKEFHGEQISEVEEDVKPQHLAYNDAMIYHQILSKCEGQDLDADAVIRVSVTYYSPFPSTEKVEYIEVPIKDLLAEVDNRNLVKGDAIVLYATALSRLKELSCEDALEFIDETVASLNESVVELSGDKEVEKMASLLQQYQSVFESVFE